MKRELISLIVLHSTHYNMNTSYLSKQITNKNTLCIMLEFLLLVHLIIIIIIIIINKDTLMMKIKEFNLNSIIGLGNKI
jgi:Ni,Fe-hydrogenase I cytochrome b subunit